MRGDAPEIMDAILLAVTSPLVEVYQLHQALRLAWVCVFVYVYGATLEDTTPEIILWSRCGEDRENVTFQ